MQVRFKPHWYESRHFRREGVLYTGVWASSTLEMPGLWDPSAPREATPRLYVPALTVHRSHRGCGSPFRHVRRSNGAVGPRYEASRDGSPRYAGRLAAALKNSPIVGPAKRGRRPPPSSRRASSGDVQPRCPSHATAPGLENPTAPNSRGSPSAAVEWTIRGHPPQKGAFHDHPIGHNG